MSRSPRSLFWTIAGMLLLTLVVGTLLQGLLAVAVLRPLEAREARARAELLVTSIANAIAALPAPPRGAHLDSLLAGQRRMHSIGPGLVVLRYRDGGVVTSPPEASRFLQREAGADSSAHPPGERRTGRFEVIARRPALHGSTVLGELEVRRRVRPGPGFFPDARLSLLFLPIALAAAFVGSLVMVRMLVARLRAMETLAARVAEGDLSVRIADKSGDEIGRLAGQLDRMAERLAEARLQLEANHEQRRQLFADITHELATPLTSIRGYAETLSDPDVPVSTEERTRYVRAMVEESGRLDRLIRDLFDLARLEAGATPLVKERLDWAALCRHTIDRFEPRFRKTGLRLVWRGTPDEAWVEADGLRIEQVLDNLLVNALRYVPAGGTVELTLERDEGRFRLRVVDDGPGLPAAELPHLFERFYRAGHGSAPAQDQAGSGLGLAIVREIVERHGGSVRAASREPRGLSVTVELPAAP